MEQMITKNNQVSKKRLTNFLLILGSPMWLTLMIGAGLLVGSFYLLMYLSVAVVGILSLASILAGLVSVVGAVFNQEIFYIMTQIGLGCMFLGLGMLLGFLTSSLAQKVQGVLNQLSKGMKKYYGN